MLMFYIPLLLQCKLSIQGVDTGMNHCLTDVRVSFVCFGYPQKESYWSLILHYYYSHTFIIL